MCVKRVTTKGYRSRYCGYEGTTANYCIYLLVILNIFKPQNCRQLQHVTQFQKPAISAVLKNRRFPQILRDPYFSGENTKREEKKISDHLPFRAEFQINKLTQKLDQIINPGN